MSVQNEKILKHIIVCEDDSLLKDVYRLALGQQLKIFDSLVEFWNLDQKLNYKNDYKLFLLDLCSTADKDGSKTISLIPLLKQKYSNAHVVVISGLSEIETMRSCVRAGVDRYILKDSVADELPWILEFLKNDLHQKALLDKKLIGESDLIKQFKEEMIKAKSQQDLNVLIEGETGTGKELCAEFLHNNKGPFVPVDMSSLSNDLFEAELFGSEKGAFTGAQSTRFGYFEAALGGTLFLDEIQNLSLANQAKLLRVLESRVFRRVGSTKDIKLNCRIVTAANRSLKEMLLKEEFREDLYYRLSVLTLQLPPLRLRRNDIPVLASSILASLNTSNKGTKFSWSQDGLQVLKDSYDWPGNVRELKAFVKKMSVHCPIPIWGSNEVLSLLSTEFEKADLPNVMPKGSNVFNVDLDLGFNENLQNLEKLLLSQAIATTSSAKEAQAKLQMSRSRFYEKLKQYEVKTK